jgi:serine/threonine protein kinase
MSWNDLIGRQLGQYTIVEELGRGGSSRVYRAVDPEMQRDVAIKALPNDAEDRVGFVRRFEREVQAVAQLNHPNIVAVYDRGETDDLVYLVMQCVTGGTFRLRLGRPLGVGEAASALAQMAQALHHAHQRGIVHRDVKPSNMLVDAENRHRLLLTDFGIAKLQGLRGLTKSGTTIGTPEYMSPEQAEGKEIDQRADVYALGCVLYEALAGRPPFVGATPVSVLYQQVHSRPAYLRGFNSDVPRDLVRVVEQALAKRPEDRFGTAEAFANALAPFAEELDGLEGLAGTADALPATTTVPSRSERRLTGAPRPAEPDERATPGEPPLAPSSPVMPVPSVPVPPPLPPTMPLASADTLQPARFEPGMGAEGLDAIFPDDADATSRRGRQSVPLEPPGVRRTFPPGTQTPERTYQRGPYDQTYHTIPLPSFRLPAKATRPLNLPLTPDGQLDMESLLAQVEEPRFRPGGPRRPTYGPQREPFPTLEPPPAAYGETGWGVAPDDAAWALERPAWVTESDTTEQPGAALRKALLETGKTRVPELVWRPDSGEMRTPVRTLPRIRRSRTRNPLLIPGAAVAALLLLALVAWVGVSASGLGLTRPAPTATVHQAIVPATVAPTATIAPTAAPTATPAPAPTATPSADAQKQLDQQAAAAFSAVTLATFRDNSCATVNNATHFAAGQTVYVNLCTSASAPGAPMAVSIVDGQGRVLLLASGFFISPNASFYFFRNSLASGSYTLVVTLTLNGQKATARSIGFSVG